MEDLNLRLVEKLWTLEEVASRSEKAHIKKVKFALETWRAQYKELKNRQDGKNGDIKDMKSDMYQLIGFFSVFQGVLFQGVTQLSIACRFRYIPMALSVAATVGTIFGVFLKFTDLLDIQERSNGDAVSIKALLYYINEIQRQGKDFSFQPPVDPSGVKDPPKGGNSSGASTSGVKDPPKGGNSSGASTSGVKDPPKGGNSSGASTSGVKDPPKGGNSSGASTSGVKDPPKGGNSSAASTSAHCVNYSNPSEVERWELKKRHDEGVVRRRARLEKELENAKRMKIIILVYLFLIGSGFAYVLSVIMCVKYY